MSFVGDSGGEINSIPQRKKIPQAIKLKRRAVCAHQRLDESAGDRIVIVDKAVTEIADPEFAINLSESPGRVEITALGEPPQKVTAGIKHIDEPTAGTGNIIFLILILLRVGHKNFAIEISDAERAIPAGRFGSTNPLGFTG